MGFNPFDVFWFRLVRRHVSSSLICVRRYAELERARFKRPLDIPCIFRKAT